MITHLLTRKRLLLALFFLVALFAYTWGNRFPYFYHSDEESKALQLLHGYRNYWHPMLMINATRLLGHLFGMDRDPQSITLIGRSIAALFSSVGLISFVHFAWSRRGPFTACLTGGLLLITPLLFEVSHYCKEDPALFMGLGLTLVALQRFLSQPDRRSLIYLGLASGLATSAKYPGALLILALLPVILWKMRRPQAGIVFLLTAVFTLLVINWQWLAHPREVITGIQRESVLLAAGHDGVAGRYPHADYLRLLRYELGLPLLGAALLGILLPQRKQNGPTQEWSVEFILGLLGLLALGALCYSAKISDRYLLPLIAIAIYLAACGVQNLHSFTLHRHGRAAIAFLLIGLIAYHPGNLIFHWLADFQRDSRADLVATLRARSISSKQLATSLWTRLPGIYQGQYSTGIVPADYVADLGTLQQLRDMGYRWIAVADVERARFDGPLQNGNSGSQSAFLRRRTFYRELEAQATLLWSTPPSYVYTLHPGLRLYELPP